MCAVPNPAELSFEVIHVGEVEYADSIDGVQMR